MKCTQCGNSKLNKVRITHSEGGWLEGVSSYVCVKCGHIEWFLDNSSTVKANNQLEQKLQQENEERIRKEEALVTQKYKTERDRLEKIINDENQSVKAVKDATKELKILDDNYKKRPKPPGTPFGW